jgi:hypothetical protein
MYNKEHPMQSGNSKIGLAQPTVVNAWGSALRSDSLCFVSMGQQLDILAVFAAVAFAGDTL